MQWSRTRFLGAGLALVLCAAMPLSQLAIAGSATVTCCCGPHDADHDCGCPDCPAAPDRDQAPADGDELRLAACDMDVDRGVAPSTATAILAPPRGASAPPACSYRARARHAELASRRVPPPTPDG